MVLEQEDMGDVGSEEAAAKGRELSALVRDIDAGKI